MRLSVEHFVMHTSAHSDQLLMKCPPSEGLLVFSRLRVYLSPHLVQLTFFCFSFCFFHLRSLFDGSKAQRTLFSLSRLHVETHIVDNTLKRLSVCVQKGRPVSLPGSCCAGSDKVAADLRVWVESTSWCCCWVPAPMSFSSPEIQQCDTRRLVSIRSKLMGD